MKQDANAFPSPLSLKRICVFGAQRGSTTPPNWGSYCLQLFFRGKTSLWNAQSWIQFNSMSSVSIYPPTHTPIKTDSIINPSESSLMPVSRSFLRLPHPQRIRLQVSSLIDSLGWFLNFKVTESQSIYTLLCLTPLMFLAFMHQYQCSFFFIVE